MRGSIERFGGVVLVGQKKKKKGFGSIRTPYLLTIQRSLTSGISSPNASKFLCWSRWLLRLSARPKGPLGRVTAFGHRLWGLRTIWPASKRKMCMSWQTLLSIESNTEPTLVGFQVVPRRTWDPTGHQVVRRYPCSSPEPTMPATLEKIKETYDDAWSESQDSLVSNWKACFLITQDWNHKMFDNHKFKVDQSDLQISWFWS